MQPIIETEITRLTLEGVQEAEAQLSAALAEEADQSSRQASFIRAQLAMIRPFHLLIAGERERGIPELQIAEACCRSIGIMVTSTANAFATSDARGVGMVADSVVKFAFFLVSPGGHLEEIEKTIDQRSVQ